MKKLLILIMVLSALLLTPMPAPAVTCTTTVPTGGDIQAAIDAADLGHVICLAAPGTYSPTATIVVDESITLTTADPYATTKPVVDGGGSLGEIIKIAADDVTIDGLEVANGTGDLIRQSGSYSGTTIRNCVVHDSSGDEGIQLKSCTDCLVECNLVYDVAQDGISIAEGAHNSIIRNNEIHHVGSENGAIYIYESSDMTVECNYIHDTEASDGIKFYNNYAGDFAVVNNRIVHNVWQKKKRATDGNAIHIYKGRAGTYTVVHNKIGRASCRERV